MERTHYRKVFKSDYLSTADLEMLIENGKSLVFTIEKVQAEEGIKLQGKKQDANVAYFKENIKPMIVNSRNSNILASFTKTNFLQEWHNIRVKLYVDNNVRFGKERVSGIRIEKTQPKETLRVYLPDDEASKLIYSLENYEISMDSIRSKINGKYSVTKEQRDKIKEAGTMTPAKLTEIVEMVIANSKTLTDFELILTAEELAIVTEAVTSSELKTLEDEEQDSPY